jgi:hypothetical protein
VYLFVRTGARWTPVRTAYVLLIGLPLCLLLFVIPSASHRFNKPPTNGTPATPSVPTAEIGNRNVVGTRRVI